MRRFILIALVIGSALVVTACGASAGSSLAGKTWQLTGITESVPAFQGAVPAADQSKYTIQFDGKGAFTAVADCNQVSGTYTTSGSNGLTIVPGPSTLAYCGDESLGDKFVTGLGQTQTYTIANDQLTLNLQDNGTLIFSAAAAAAS
jgi:heat shock protein HslJ